jgi:hypothetical protein
MIDDETRARYEAPAPACDCGLSGEWLHADDCRRLVGLVEKYRPRGLSVEKNGGRRVVVRET